MPKSCRQRVVEAAFAKLQAVPAQETLAGYSSVKTELNRRAPLEETELPFNGMFEGPETPLNDFIGLDLYALTLFVQIAVLGSGETAFAFANSLRADTIKVLKSDFTLGGLARLLELSEEPENFVGVDVAADSEGAILAFTVHYATNEGDPFTFA